MVPYDVLVDPQSLPNHPVLSEKKDMMEIVHRDSIAEAEKNKKESNSDSQVNPIYNSNSASKNRSHMRNNGDEI